MLQLSIVTPEGLKFSGDVNKVSMPAADGQIEIYAGHVPFMATSEPGMISFTDLEGKEEFIIVDKGFIQIDSDIIKVLVEDAKVPSEINDKEIQTQIAIIEKDLAGKNTLEKDYILKDKQLKYFKALIEK